MNLNRINTESTQQLRQADWTTSSQLLMLANQYKLVVIDNTARAHLDDNRMT